MTNGRIINVIIEKDTTNKYYVSIIVSVITSKVEPSSIVGIDLEIKDLIVTSDGERYHNLKEFSKREKQLKRLQHKLPRKTK